MNHNLKMFFACIGLAALTVWIWVGLSGCSPLYNLQDTEIKMPIEPTDGKVVVIIPEVEMNLMGANAYNPWLKPPRAGLWWTNGAEHRIYVKGYRYRERDSNIKSPWVLVDS